MIDVKQVTVNRITVTCECYNDCFNSISIDLDEDDYEIDNDLIKRFILHNKWKIIEGQAYCRKCSEIIMEGTKK